MSKALHFSAASSVKNLFGRGLVTDQIAAVFELVKNSYDADATEVNIQFEGLETDSPSLVISDNGTGMDLRDIEHRWMVIGTDSKKNIMYSPLFGRPINGDKGIGRFSVDRLGDYLHLEAQKRNTDKKYFVEFDWTLFDGETKNISDIDIPYSSSMSESDSGVLLKISGLRDEWNGNSVKELFRNLRQFKSPFTQEDNFKIYITAKKYGYEKCEVTVEKLENISSLWMTAAIEERDQDVIHIVVNRDGMEYESKQSNPYKFGSVKTKIFMFNQGDKVRFVNRYGLRVREYGNIRLYRDDFRVYPYGEEYNDWLEIDRRQTQGLWRSFGTRDIIGYIQITKKYNPDLKPLTNRQGLEENAYFKQLRQFLVDTCISTLESYYFTKIKKGSNETINKTKAGIGGAVEGLDKLAGEIKSSNPEVARQIKGYATRIKEEQNAQLQYVQDQKEIVKVYSRIAQKETFLHKLIHQSMIRVKDADVALSAFISSAPDLYEEYKEGLDNVQNCVKDALSLLRTVRDDVVKKRTKSHHNIGDLVSKYIKDNAVLFTSSSIIISLMVKGDLNYNVDPGDISAIVNNLATNAVKSLVKVGDRQRTILFEVYRTSKFIFIRCTDNGIGIPEADRERIFDPFQSTTDGFGLGLTIIDEIAREYGGNLELVETGIGACFSVKLRC